MDFENYIPPWILDYLNNTDKDAIFFIIMVVLAISAFSISIKLFKLLYKTLIFTLGTVSIVTYLVLDIVIEITTIFKYLNEYMFPTYFAKFIKKISCHSHLNTKNDLHKLVMNADSLRTYNKMDRILSKRNSKNIKNNKKS